MLSESSDGDIHVPLFVPETLLVEDEDTGEADDQSHEGKEEAITELKSCLDTLERSENSHTALVKQPN